MAVEDLETAETRLDWGTSASPRLSIGREPVTYERHDQSRSYVKDFVLSRIRGDGEAEARLQRHAVEMRSVEQRERERRSDEFRAVSWTVGSGGYFAPPLWLIREFAAAPASERVCARLCPNFELPVGPQTINVPRLTTGFDAEIEVPDESAADRTPVDSSVQSAVVGIAGNADIPIQLLEHSPIGASFDFIVFTDLKGEYEHVLDQQILTGAGASVSQLTGIIPASPTIAYSGAATGSAMFAAIGQTIAAFASARKKPAQAWVMGASRLAWIGTAEDTALRPFALGNYLHELFPISSLVDYPVYTDEAMPRTLGVGGNQDALVLVRPDDWLLFESAPKMQIMPDVLSGALQIRIQLRQYAAFINRYPSSVATLGGTGLIVQANF